MITQWAGRQFSPADLPNKWAWLRNGLGLTGALNVSNWADGFGLGHDAAQATGANQPINLLHSGTNYLWLPGVAGNHATTPDSAAISLTGDQSIAIRFAANDWTPGTIYVFFNHDNSGAGHRGIAFYLTTDGKLNFFWSPDGGVTPTVKTSSAATGLTDGAAAWLLVSFDVNNGAGGSDVKFYTAPDSAALPTSWTQLGTTQTTAGVTQVFNTDEQLTIGNDFSTTDPCLGKMYRAVYFSGVVDATGAGGTIVFDANFANVAEDATSFTESSSNGATVTINSTGAKKAQIVGQSSVLFDGSAHFLKTVAATLNQPSSVVLFGRQVTWTASDWFTDGFDVTSRMIIGQRSGGASPQLQLYAGSFACNNSGLALNTNGMIVAGFNAASSFIQINNGSPDVGDAGTQNGGGFTLGSDYFGTANSNIQIKEAIVLSGALDAATIAKLYRYGQRMRYCA